MNKKTIANDWNLYLKELQKTAQESKTPYKIIPYKNGKGIKRVIIEKQVA